MRHEKKEEGDLQMKGKVEGSAVQWREGDRRRKGGKERKEGRKVKKEGCLG